MSGRETVLGLGPLPKKAPRYRIVGRRPAITVVDVLKAARVRESVAARDALFPGFTQRDGELAATRVVLTGANLRPAGLNVPVRVTERKIYFPFSVVKLKRKRGVRF